MRANNLHPYCDRLAGTRKPKALDTLNDIARPVVAVLRLWRCRRHDRRQLAKFAQLDDRMLADIGLTRGSAEFLINKPFWRE